MSERFTGDDLDAWLEHFSLTALKSKILELGAEKVQDLLFIYEDAELLMQMKEASPKPLIFKRFDNARQLTDTFGVSKISLSVSPSTLPTKDLKPPLETIYLNDDDSDRKPNIFNYSHNDYDDDNDYNGNYKYAPNIKIETSNERARKFAKKTDNSRSSSTNTGGGNNYSSGSGSAFHRQPSFSSSSKPPPPPPQRKIEGTYLHIYNHLL